MNDSTCLPTFIKTQVPFLLLEIFLTHEHSLYRNDLNEILSLSDVVWCILSLIPSRLQLALSSHLASEFKKDYEETEDNLIWKRQSRVEWETL